MKKNYSHPEIKVFKVSVHALQVGSPERFEMRINTSQMKDDARQSKNSMWDSFEVDDEE